MSNAFTPPGTSSRNSQIKQGEAAATQAGNLIPGAAGYDAAQQADATANLPGQEQGVQNALYNTTQGGRNAETASYGQGQTASAENAEASAGSKFAGNSQLAAGYGLSAANQGNENTANYAAAINSPGAENSAWSTYNNAANAVKPNYGNVSQLASTVYGQPAQPVGQGLGSFLGQAVGSFVGGQGFSKLLGGGGGSGNGGGAGAAAVTGPGNGPNQYYDYGDTGDGTNDPNNGAYQGYGQQQS